MSECKECNGPLYGHIAKEFRLCDRCATIGSNEKDQRIAELEKSLLYAQGLVAVHAKAAEQWKGTAEVATKFRLKAEAKLGRAREWYLHNVFVGGAGQRNVNGSRVQADFHALKAIINEESEGE